MPNLDVPACFFDFNSPEDLILHETNHRKQICHSPGCQYPLFSSAKILKDRMGKFHVQRSRTVPRKSIKKHVQPSGPTLNFSFPSPPSVQEQQRFNGSLGIGEHFVKRFSHESPGIVQLNYNKMLDFVKPFERASDTLHSFDDLYTADILRGDINISAFDDAD
ncbi:uncharacterized protein TrAFT101_007057 [Trichoderma asperellum]|uniref:Uncharacterized protein n=1 Tax=Trichoderma asperellum (strain ATCC 204424 / CBS 433.97 / NBRC 101777) TaxID=1042311 RepID=A0A2T3Z2I9_TRIA4|nr:hypothetical protein M441DRAFT_71371 [Trichoderma asperellum CBS 433.97]PTB39031.1 hypothetical protein M441DRAFT_71371 [Trichoderma asperellum CBS 433.97]UKZ92088.1 hypothetical protein TrAFT101_007057 [Trichoderma asperellum]